MWIAAVPEGGPPFLSPASDPYVVIAMCGPETPMTLELEEVPWRKFECRDCGRIFRIMSRTPRCPGCHSSNLKEL